jgi:peptidoglycan lytic transglycosylase D
MADISLEEVHRLNAGYHRGVTDPKGSHRLLLPVDRVDKFKARLANWSADPELAERRTSPARDSEERRVGFDDGGEIDQEPTRAFHHTVRKGETLAGIARRYQTTVSVLKHTNTLSGGNIRAGTRLLIPASRNARTRSVASAGELLKAVSARPRSEVFHIVAQGETAWTISRRYHISMQQLRSWNRLSSKEILRPGQKLIVRMSKGAELVEENSRRSNGAFARSVRSNTVVSWESMAGIAGD